MFLHVISQLPKTRISVPSYMTALLPITTRVWRRSDILSNEYLTIAEIMRCQRFVTAAFIQNGNAGPWAGLHQGISFLFNEGALGDSIEEIIGDILFTWIEKHKGRYFFLYMHILDLHGIYNPPSPFDRWYHEDRSNKTPVEEKFYIDPYWIESPPLEGCCFLYDGEILHNDSLLSDIINHLNDFEIFTNSFVVFTSDHGVYLGEHGFWDHHPPGYL